MERRGRFLCIVKLRSKSAFTTDRYTSYNKQSRSEFRRVELRLCYPPAGTFEIRSSLSFARCFLSLPNL
jgi:hypothetical protein